MDTVHECVRQMDGQTDRQTDGETDRITITKTVQRRASHGKNHRLERVQATTEDVFRFAATRCTVTCCLGVPRVSTFTYLFT